VSLRAVWILGFLLPALAQQKPVEPQEEVPVFRTGSSLALVAFHVVQHNRYAMDIRLGDIELLEDGRPRRISSLRAAHRNGKCWWKWRWFSTSAVV
jgi:hypothetical protein